MTILIQITTLVIVVIIASIQIIGKSYLSKKGQNLATKEDVGQITKIVETVKDDFIKENEKLKSRLNFESNNKLQYYQEERNSILGFLKSYLHWRER